MLLCYVRTLSFCEPKKTWRTLCTSWEPSSVRFLTAMTFVNRSGRIDANIKRVRKFAGIFFLQDSCHCHMSIQLILRMVKSMVTVMVKVMVMIIVYAAIYAYCVQITHRLYLNLGSICCCISVASISAKISCTCCAFDLNTCGVWGLFTNTCNMLYVYKHM